MHLLSRWQMDRSIIIIEVAVENRNVKQQTTLILCRPLCFPRKDFFRFFEVLSFWNMSTTTLLTATTSIPLNYYYSSHQNAKYLFNCRLNNSENCPLEQYDTKLHTLMHVEINVTSITTTETSRLIKDIQRKTCRPYKEQNWKVSP